jgi:EME1/MUS81, C-terminal
VSDKKAKAIARLYPSLGRLVREYRDPRRSNTEKVTLLQGLPVIGNSKHTTVGATVSRKLYQLLSATDPSFTVS